MIEQNKKEFEICNIFQWWNKGYTGKNIKIAEIEGFNTDAYFLKNKVVDFFNRGKSGGSTHGTQVLDVMHQSAPDATLYSLPYGLISDSLHIEGTFVEQTLPYIVKENIHIIGASLGGINNDLLNKEIEKAKEKGACFITSAGNRGTKGLGNFAKSDIWMSVGADGYDDKLENTYLKNYSSRGQELDIVGFSGLYIHPSKEGYNPFQVEGTSFSSPLICGMCALAQQFFLEKTGRTLFQWELEKFIYDHVIDLGEIGWDENYGHGLFVLPHPDDIDIKKYVPKYMEDEKMEIKLQINSNKYYVNGIEKYMDTVPILNKDDRTMVPVRFIAEAFGAKVEWDNDNQIVTITY